MAEHTDSAALDHDADAVLEYWFGPRDGDEWGKLRKIWFGGGPQVDDEIRAQFGALHVRACAGELDHWQQSPLGTLALLIVLDQFSRNLHRGTAAAFAADAKAREIASRAIDRDFDEQLLPVQRWFVYLPFEHAESLADQRRALTLFEALPADSSRDIAVDYAKKHLEVIEKFGRFPHRNEMLGRPSTPEETRWLADGGHRFG
jgi:uncharacterized protein (DUF924 family)